VRARWHTFISLIMQHALRHFSSVRHRVSRGGIPYYYYYYYYYYYVICPPPLCTRTIVEHTHIYYFTRYRSRDVCTIYLGEPYENYCVISLKRGIQTLYYYVRMHAADIRLCDGKPLHYILTSASLRHCGNLHGRLSSVNCEQWAELYRNTIFIPNDRNQFAGIVRRSGSKLYMLC
jgi:hypothetical protein